MNKRTFNLFLMVLFSSGIFMSEQASVTDSVSSLVKAIPGKLEHFVKDDPKAAAAVIVALASVIIFKDVIVSGAQKMVKTIKENPVISLGVSLILAGAAYGYWDHYYNHEPDFIEGMLNSVQNGAHTLSKNISTTCSQVKNWYSTARRPYDYMTYESSNKVREAVENAKAYTK